MRIELRHCFYVLTLTAMLLSVVLLSSHFLLLYAVNALVLVMVVRLWRNPRFRWLVTPILLLYMLSWISTYISSGMIVELYAKEYEYSYNAGVNSRFTRLKVEPHGAAFPIHDGPWYYVGKPFSPCPFIIILDHSVKMKSGAGLGCRDFVAYLCGYRYRIYSTWRWSTD